MFRLLLPYLQGILVRETNEVDFLAVLAGVRLDRDESRNLLDELVHPPGSLAVGFRVRSVPERGFEDDDDLGRVLHAAIRHLSALTALRALEDPHAVGNPTEERRVVRRRPDHADGEAGFDSEFLRQRLRR